MSSVAVVDHGLCNLDSIRRALEECGASPVVTESREEIARADRIVLPGVGAFPDAMALLRAKGLDEVLRERVTEHGVPILGICLGMQLLAKRGTEGATTSGLGLIDGEVLKLAPGANSERLPHVGWNSVTPAQQHPLFAGIQPGRDFYFVHSFHLRPTDPKDTLAVTPYCGGFTSAVARDNVMGVQFHPEKSQRVGFALLKNFLRF